MTRPIATEQNRHPGWEIVDILDDLVSGTSIKSIQMNSLVPVAYDYIGVTWTGSDPTTIVYKTGGALGATVATLTLAFTAGKVDTITKT